MTDHRPLLVPEAEASNDPPERGGRSGCSGCGMLFAGMGVAVALVIAAFALAVLLGFNTVGGVLDGVVGIFNPPPPVYTTVSAALILERVQGMSQLTTTRYNFSNIVTTERELPPVLRALYGDRLVVVMVGHINAGIDLGVLTENDITLTENTLTIRLPPPALQECFINEQESYVVSRDTGLFASPAPTLDQEARRFAVRVFREMALEENILPDASQQAADIIEAAVSLLLDALETEQAFTVQIVPASPDPDTPLPLTCR
jgi:hypothetical protein